MKWFKASLYTITGLVLLLALLVYVGLRASLPQYQGEYQADVKAKVQLSRDANGYLSINADSRLDAAYALGFAHAQERFFQMDLLRRNAAGELSELFGEKALQLDISRRMHRFRDRAETAVAQLPKPQLELLQHYTLGVNAALLSLSLPPFEYGLLLQKPRPWQEADSLLVVFSMYLDLQGALGKDELAQQQLKQAVPAEWYRFFNQHSSDWQAAIDGSEVKAVAMPDSPYPFASAKTACQHCGFRDSRDIGSNNFAVAGALTPHGSAILADDMHLGIRVPGTWYKAQLNWRAGDKKLQVTGVTLPGTPSVVAGSNGHIAWGFTNSTADWQDLIKIKAAEDPLRYQTPAGDKEYSYNNEVIKIKGKADHIMLVKETQWGPLMAAPFDGYALRWVAYDKAGINLNLLTLEQATSVDEALKLAPAVGVPAQNLLVADKNGDIGWTLIGAIPNRQLKDMDVPQDWSDGDNYWDGYLDASAYPKLKNPANQRLWTANARTVGGKSLQLIGDGGYDLGARGQQIRDALLAKDQHNEQSLHQIQLDHRALFLQRWKQLLLEVLSDDFVKEHQLEPYLAQVKNGAKAAHPDDAGYPLVRAFRDETLELMFAPLAALLETQKLTLADLKLSPETPGWALLQAKRADTLPEGFSSWQMLLQQAVLKSKKKLLEKHQAELANLNWGSLNTVELQHPLSKALPLLSPLLDMPAKAMAGDRHMPRVQRPEHGQSERMVVAPGQEQHGILTIPGGQSGHPLSEFYRADHAFWAGEKELGFLPGAEKYLLELQPRG
ncbi:penicillin acylase family protein [Rheinheimera sp.]|uniref:penicillin acylase family protein n=1 Tax=Rheinheimera sp. TaxID=1869214 RepID=UPI0027B9B445|nr:penicillin acylase family protein [Rheinheimera sp.]